ncbi:MAG: DUF4388 domain-containing protein [bacterium]
MSFRGELREFELPDILQLIASQKKAGWLKVISRSKCHFVFFRDGKITSTKNPSEENDPFEDFIVRKGILTDEQTDRMAAIRRKTGLDISDILRKEGLLSADEIRELFEAMVEQDIFELMSIRAGTYEFETEERPTPLPEGTLSAEIAPILMEGARKADEVTEMRRGLGPEDGVLVMSAAGRVAIPEDADQRAVLALVNGVRTIDAIIEESALDRYTATRTLFDCARRGWVSLLRSHGARASADEPEATSVDRGRAIRALAPALALLLVSVLLSDALDRFRSEDPLAGEWLKWNSEILATSRQDAVRVAVESYRVIHGTYPQQLAALTDAGLLAPEAIQRGETPLWTYAVLADSTFSLAPAPPPAKHR